MSFRKDVATKTVKQEVVTNVIVCDRCGKEGSRWLPGEYWPEIDGWWTIAQVGSPGAVVAVEKHLCPPCGIETMSTLKP